MARIGITSALRQRRASRADLPPHPNLSLALISAQHALIHAQTALMPLVFVAIIPLFDIGVGEIGLLVAAGNLLGGALQLVYGGLTRLVSRRAILGGGGLVFGVGMTALSVTTSWIPFALASVFGRLGGSPQHTVGNALLAEQFPARRVGFAISTHIAVGNLGTVAIPLVGGWLIATGGWSAAVLALGLPAIAVAVAILVLVRESGADRAAAVGAGSTLAAYRSLRGERALLRLFLASSISAAGRGLGIVSLFVPLYLALSIGLDGGTVAGMYTLFLAGSVPGPLVAGWIADRVGHQRVLVATYVLAVTSIVVMLLAGSSVPLLWLSMALLGAFVFEESSLLQTVVADVARPAIRDVAFSAYFTLMFVVGAVWAGAMGWLIGALGNDVGFPVAFGIMAVSYVLAAVVVLRIDEPDRGAANQSASDQATSAPTSTGTSSA